MRVKVTLRCNEYKQRNYNTMKNKKNTPDKLELNKYCQFCRKHTPHTETKYRKKGRRVQWLKRRKRRIAASGSAR